MDDEKSKQLHDEMTVEDVPQPPSVDFFKPPNPMDTVLAPVNPAVDDGSSWTWEMVDAAAKAGKTIPMKAVMRFGKKLKDLTREEKDMIFGQQDPFEEVVPEPPADGTIPDEAQEMEFIQDNASFTQKFGEMGGDDDDYKTEPDNDLTWLTALKIPLANTIGENMQMTRPQAFFERPRARHPLNKDGTVDKTKLERDMRLETVYLDTTIYPHPITQQYYVGVYQPPIDGAEIHLREFAVLGFAINQQNAESLHKQICALAERGEVWGFPFVWQVGRAVILPFSDMSTSGKLIANFNSNKEMEGSGSGSGKKKGKRQHDLYFRSNPSLTQIGCNGLNLFVFSYFCPNPKATHQTANCLALIVHAGFADEAGVKMWMKEKKDHPREGDIIWPDMYTREMCNGIQLPPPLPTERIETADPNELPPSNM